MKLSKFLKASGYSINDTAKFQWKCFPNGMFINVNDINGDEVAGCIFNTETQQVYEVAVTTPNNAQDQVVALRWQEPKFSKAYADECAERGVIPNLAWDDVLWQDTDKDTILKAVTDVIHCNYDSWTLPSNDNNSALLLPCPFCNNANLLYTEQGCDDKHFYVKCGFCRALGPESIDLSTCKNFWNTRQAQSGFLPSKEKEVLTDW